MSAIAVRRKHVLSVARALADITSTDPVLIRSSVLKAVVEAAGSDACVFYSFVDVGGVASVEGLTAEGPKRSVAVRPFLETEAPHWYDVSRPPEPALTGFWSPMLAVPRAQFEASPMFEQVCKPYGIHETAGLFFYHGEKYLGTLSALWMRPKDFTLEERALLMPLVAPVRAGIVAADCLSRRGLPDETAHLLLRAGGEVEYASRVADVWLKRPGIQRALSRRVRQMDRRQEPTQSAPLEAAEAQVVRLRTSEGIRYLVCLKPSQQIRRDADTLLTPAQLRVARLAAVGATVPEIAKELARSAETVRSHLAQVYRRLRTSNRVELARALEPSSTRNALEGFDKSALDKSTLLPTSRRR
jgi:DNA-binding CsgD family transcriptional regulator